MKVSHQKESEPASRNAASYPTVSIKLKPSDETIERQFAGCREALRLIAQRVLGNDEDVHQAMQRSYEVASGLRSKFENQGAFRSWLVRCLLNEALMILHEKKSASAETLEQFLLWGC